MQKNLVSLLCATLIVGAGARAFAGAYGEAEHAQDMPAAAPAQMLETRVQTGDYGRVGPYVQIGATYGFEDFEIHSLTGQWDDSWGYEARAGYRMNPMFSTEVQWQHFLSFAGPGASRASGASESDIESSMLSTNGKLYPLSGRFQPYVLTGLGWQNAQQKDGFEEDAFSMRFGAGMDVYFTSNIGMAVEAGYIWPVNSQLADAEEVNIIPVSASIFFRFM